MIHDIAIFDPSAPSLSPEKAARSFHAERVPLAPPPPDRDFRWRWGVAILAALLLHLGVITTIDDGFQRSKPAMEPPVPVEIVTEPPAPPPPPPKPVEKPPELQKPVERQPDFSGGEQEDKAFGAPDKSVPTEKPPAATSTPEPPVPAPAKPTTAPALPNDSRSEATSVPPSSTSHTTQQALTPPPLPSRKPPAPVERLSTNTTPSQAESTPAPPNPALPLGEGGGNKYLNALRDEILRHKFYPPTAELFGWQGETRYQIVIDRQGRLVRLRVLSSSGYDILDKAGFIAIQQAAPFAPIPSNLWPNVDPVGLVFIADWSKDSQ